MFDIPDNSFPHNLEAEQAILGAILLDGSTAVSCVNDKLKPEHFHIKLHSDLYAVLQQMFMTAQPIDLVTTIEYSVRQGVFENQTEAKTYLARLMETAINPSSISAYSKIVEEKALVRSLMYVSK